MNKSFKQAIVSCFTVIIVCLLTLVGTSYAWFTDTASTEVNKIQAGNLDVELEMKDSNGNWVNAENKTLDFLKAIGHEDEDILFEPGSTYELPTIRIVNNGNLALKYKITINGINGDEILLEKLDFTIKKGDEIASLEGWEETILSGEMSTEITITATMKSDAGNEYQNKMIDGISITVIATQASYEYDSYNNQYDSNAEYPLDFNKVKDALENENNLTLSSNVNIYPSSIKNPSELITITKDTNLDLSDKTLGFNNSIESKNYDEINIINVTDGTLTINGTGTIDCEAGNNKVNGIVVNGGHVIIEGGNFYGAPTAVLVQSGMLEIYGGFFDMATSYKSNSNPKNDFIIDVLDSNFMNGTALIVIKGGTFVNFNPADNATGGDGTVYTPVGYTVVSETKDNGDIWYTVKSM